MSDSDVNKLVDHLDNILGHITSINDERDVVGILLALNDQWPALRELLLRRDQWEYKIVAVHGLTPVESEVRLDKYGSQNWELVSAHRENYHDQTFYFKRRKGM